MQLVTRKIRKGQYGLSTPSFSNIGNAFSNAVKPNLNFQSQLGDMTALSLITNQSLGTNSQSSSTDNSDNSNNSSTLSNVNSFINPIFGKYNYDGIKKGLTSKAANGIDIAGQILGSVSDIIPTLDNVHNSNDQMSSDIRSGASKALLSGVAGPWGQVAGAALLAFDKTGGFTDASKGLGGANDALNMVASLAIPGAGWFTKKTMDYDISKTLQQSGASYGGTLDKANTAAQNAGAKILFGRSKANNMIGNAILADTKVQNIMNENDLAQAGANNPFIGIRNQFNMQGGWQQGTVRYGRKGMSIQILERTKNIISNIKETHELNSSPVEYIDDIVEVTLYDDIPKHKNGGSIIELTPVPTEILLVNPADIPEFQEGGTISQKIKDYYKDYDLDKVVVMQGEPRTEADTIYANNDEDQAHELWHWISQNKPNENLKYFYDNLNDQRIQELGGDLNFINRTGDPNDFYHPSEIEARLKAAKFMSQGQQYTKDFFSNLRKNENKYGYNMRDLLHMYNDENLEKLFNTSLQSFKEGGSINVIPDGALHARKHNMDMEGITKKGIPVVADKENGEIEQQAEIEKEEIIFRLEVTKKLEELEKKYYNSDTSQKEKDELALEAGKLLVQEILYNTMDNVNLIDKV